MNDNGDLKDDVAMPEGEVGEKITKLFKTEEKDTSKLPRVPVVVSPALSAHHVSRRRTCFVFPLFLMLT